MAKIHEYPIESFELNDDDFLDIDFFDVGSATYQTRKIKGIAVKQSTDVFVKSTLGAVAISNDYNDLDNLPVIPTPISNHSQLVLDDGTNPHGTTATDVGLGNVDNTSDLNKPISTATQLALDDKQDELISGVNIKTIDGQSILGVGDIPFPVAPLNKFNQQMYAFDMSPASGFSWNGLIVGGSSLVTLSERWRLQSFSGTGQPDGVYGNFCLPSTYTAGNDIRVVLKLTCGSAGNAFFGCGLTALGVLGDYGIEADAIYQTAIVPFLPNFNDDTLTFIFSGASLTPLKPIAINVYREPQNPGDTNTAVAYINQIMIEEV
jgi:hypothetical protein